MNYSIKDFKPFEKNTLRGFFSLAVDALEIEGFTYHEKDGKRWVGMPARQFEDENGELSWHQTVFIRDENRYKKFQRWAVDEVKKVVPAEGSEPEQQDNLPF